jgi:hypothetical protein
MVSTVNGLLGAYATAALQVMTSPAVAAKASASVAKLNAMVFKMLYSRYDLWKTSS